MNFEEKFKSWTLEQKVEWALGLKVFNLSEKMRSIIVDLKAETERLNGELDKRQQELMGECELRITIENIRDNLETENEQLKRELKQTEAQDQVVIDELRKENARLRCTALHLFSKHFFDCYWNIEGPNHIRYLHLHEKYDEAYRKAKKALREEK